MFIGTEIIGGMLFAVYLTIFNNGRQIFSYLAIGE